MQLIFPTQTYSFLQCKTSMHNPQNMEETPLQLHTKKGSHNGLPSLFICREEISCSLPEDPQLRSLSPPKSLRS